MAAHEVLPFLRELSAKLATRSRHVCMFLGAGASRACGLPDMATLDKQIAKRLDEHDRDALQRMRGEGRNIEQVLSRLRRIATLLEVETERVDGLTAEQARNLDSRICEHIVKALALDGADASPMRQIASWLGRADYRLPIEVFTVNYDLGLEMALESLGVPYFDGFVGSLKAPFRADLVEANAEDPDNWLPAFLVRLWKLHGSVNWQWDRHAGANVKRLGVAVSSGSLAAIYPSDTKYDESRRVPFVVLQDRFRRALNQPESLVLICGYSFGDNHLNEMIFDAARRRPRSEFSVFYFDTIPDELASRAGITPNLQVLGRKEAIIGGTRAKWQPPVGDDIPDGLWETEGGQGDGEFALPDFAKFAAYLARSSLARGENDAHLEEPFGEGH